MFRNITRNTINLLDYNNKKTMIEKVDVIPNFV